jgi:hypothetical protein
MKLVRRRLLQVAALGILMPAAVNSYALHCLSLRLPAARVNPI